MATAKRQTAGSRQGSATGSRARSASGAKASGTASSSGRGSRTAQKTPPKTGGKSQATGATSRKTAGSTRDSAAAKQKTARASSRDTTSAKKSASDRKSSAGRSGANHQRITGRLRETGAAIVQVADRASGPTLAVAAAAAGIAGGLALRQRPHNGVSTRSRHILHDIDPATILQGLGKASTQLSQRSKGVARDIERVADRAERIGKILS
jgi:hypothetical protein